MRINNDKLLKEFMYNGYFSEYLPKNFNLECGKKDIYEIQISDKNDYVEPYCYTMSRFTEDGKRRNIYIPELLHIF